MICLLFLIMTAIVQPEARLETWTDNSGSYSVEAKFLGISKGKVVLERKDGIEVRVPYESLSRESLLLIIKHSLPSLPEPPAKEEEAPATKEVEGTVDRAIDVSEIVEKFDVHFSNATDAQINERSTKLAQEAEKYVKGKIFVARLYVQDVQLNNSGNSVFGEWSHMQNSNIGFPIGPKSKLPITKINKGDILRLRGQIGVVAGDPDNRRGPCVFAPETNPRFYFYFKSADVSLEKTE